MAHLGSRFVRKTFVVLLGDVWEAIESFRNTIEMKMKKLKMNKCEIIGGRMGGGNNFDVFLVEFDAKTQMRGDNLLKIPKGGWKITTWS